MPRYNLLDDKDKVIGFAVIHVEATKEFQSVAGYTGGNGGALSASGPVAESVLFLAVVGGLTGAILASDFDGWLAASVGVTGGLLVAGLRAWRSGQYLAVDEQEPEVLIRGEFKSSDGTIYLDEIKDKRIQYTSLVKVCNAIDAKDYAWMGRPTMMLKTGISRGQYDLIKQEFTRLQYFIDDGNMSLLSSRGRLFVRKIAEYEKRKKR